jgi:hypothetical protein
MEALCTCLWTARFRVDQLPEQVCLPSAREDVRYNQLPKFSIEDAGMRLSIAQRHASRSSEMFQCDGIVVVAAAACL